MKRYIVLSILLIVPASAPSFAQTALDTFYVSVGLKTPANPYYGRGTDSTFYTDGVEAKELTLLREKLYAFQMMDIPRNFEWYITPNSVGEARGPFVSGGSRYMATTNQYFTFKSRREVDSLLYYQSANHAYAGWKMHMVDSIVSNADDESIVLAGAIINLDRVSPDPCDRRAFVIFDLASAAELRLVVVNSFGTIVYEVLEHRQAGTQQSIAVNTSALPNGLYVLGLATTDRLARATGTLRVVR